jgi:hypothetical protein
MRACPRCAPRLYPGFLPFQISLSLLSSCDLEPTYHPRPRLLRERESSGLWEVLGRSHRLQGRDFYRVPYSATHGVAGFPPFVLLSAKLALVASPAERFCLACYRAAFLGWVPRFDSRRVKFLPKLGLRGMCERPSGRATCKKAAAMHGQGKLKDCQPLNPPGKNHPTVVNVRNRHTWAK